MVGRRMLLAELGILALAVSCGNGGESAEQATLGDLERVGVVSAETNGFVCVVLDEGRPSFPGDLFYGQTEGVATLKAEPMPGSDVARADACAFEGTVDDGVDIGDRVLVTWDRSGTIRRVEPSSL